MHLRLPQLSLLVLSLLAACGKVITPAAPTDLAVAAPVGGEIVAWGSNAQNQLQIPHFPKV